MVVEISRNKSNADLKDTEDVLEMSGQTHLVDKK